jgi:hypothetical protein
MAEHLKFFRHDGDRTPETDKTAEELAVHALRDEHPGAHSIVLTWVHHNQPDCWLLFVGGTTPEEE